MLLNHNEERVLALIEENPFLTQQAIAEALEMNRSTVATVISSLTEKKQLLGRAYVLNQGMDIVCIGGMNIDRKYVLSETFMPKTSNPVTSSISVGGVGRNIAENLGRMNLKVTLLSVAGQDQDYEFIKQETETYVNLQHVTIIPDEPTSSYSAILDGQGDMQFALADMLISDRMDAAWLNQHRNLLLQAEMIVLDLNVTREVVEGVIQLAKTNQIPLIIIPVSGPKMNRLPKELDGVNWLIINQDESEAFHNHQVETEDDVEVLGQKWLDTGLEQVLITRGSQPTYYAHQDGRRLNIQPPRADHVVDVTGAGDSNASGIIYGIMKGLDPQDCIQLGMTNAYHTVQSQFTVRHELNETNLLKENKTLHEKG